MRLTEGPFCGLISPMIRDQKLESSGQLACSRTGLLESFRRPARKPASSPRVTPLRSSTDATFRTLPHVLAPARPPHRIADSPSLTYVATSYSDPAEALAFPQFAFDLNRISRRSRSPELRARPQVSFPPLSLTPAIALFLSTTRRAPRLTLTCYPRLHMSLTSCAFHNLHST